MNIRTIVIDAARQPVFQSGYMLCPRCEVETFHAVVQPSDNVTGPIKTCLNCNFGRSYFQEGIELLGEEVEEED